MSEQDIQRLPPFITVSEAAAMIRVSERTMYRIKADHPELSSETTGKLFKEKVLAYARRCKQQEGSVDLV